jgi:hypothetical protein
MQNFVGSLQRVRNLQDEIVVILSEYSVRVVHGVGPRSTGAGFVVRSSIVTSIHAESKLLDLCQRVRGLPVKTAS